MRLFIGIKTGCEAYLSSLQQELKKAGSGRFTEAGNLHLTLKFLGEVPPARLGDIREAMSALHAEVFALECLGIEMLNKNGIVSVRIGGEVGKLAALQAGLEDTLSGKGFQKEGRAFRPHITLARNFRALPGCDIAAIPYRRQRFTVREMTLFESRREAGRLVYWPLFTCRFEENTSP